jgi:6-phosphogluconolactonase
MPKLRIEYQVLPSPAELARAAAGFFVEQARQAVQARGRARIAISGGSTPEAVFRLLASPEEPYRAQMPWDRIELFWVDERCVPPDQPDSNYRMTREALLDRVPLPAAQIHRMEGELEPEIAAARYESALRNAFRLEGAELPRFDLVALGMGEDGHTASLFPSTEALNALTPLVVANHVPQKNAWRLTLTWPVLNQASQVFFLIAGAAKAGIVHQVFTGPRDPERLPSQLISPASGILTVMLDKAAAAQLPAPDESGRSVIERRR